MTPDAEDTRATDYTRFKGLRVLSSDETFINCLEIDYGRSPPSKRIALPDSIETLILPYYPEPRCGSGPPYDSLFIELFKTPLLPNLKKVVVPSKPIGVNCRPINSPDELKDWSQRRLQLKKEERSGNRKFKLHFVDVGDISSDSFDGERFLSSLRWYSP